MPNATAALSLALNASPSGKAPERIHILPAGTFAGRDGRGPYTLKDADHVIARSMADGKLPVDENHSTDIAAPKGQPSPALAWMTSLEQDKDGLWAIVEWTPPGRQMMADQAYRGISPVFMHDTKTGEVVQILRASLTNTPNLAVKTLHSQSSIGDLHMDMMAQIKKLLELDDAADDKAVLDAVTALSKQVTTQAAKPAPELTNMAKALASALGLKADGQDVLALGEKVLASVKSLQSSAQTMATSLATLEGEVSRLKSAEAQAKAEAAIDASITQGKPIKPLRDHYITRHMADPEAVAKELAGLPSLHASGLVTHQPAAGSAGVVSPDSPPAEIVKAAQAYQHAQKQAGQDIAWDAAVNHVVHSTGARS